MVGERGKARVVDAQVIVEAGRELEAMTGDVARCRRAPGEPVVLTPVREVVAALGACARKVGDLVPVEPGSGEHLDGDVVEVGFEVGV